MSDKVEYAAGERVWYDQAVGLIPAVVVAGGKLQHYAVKILTKRGIAEINVFPFQLLPRTCHVDTLDGVKE